MVTNTPPRPNLLVPRHTSALVSVSSTRGSNYGKEPAPQQRWGKTEPCAPPAGEGEGTPVPTPQKGTQLLCRQKESNTQKQTLKGEGQGELARDRGPTVQSAENGRDRVSPTTACSEAGARKTPGLPSCAPSCPSPHPPVQVSPTIGPPSLPSSRVPLPILRGLGQGSSYPVNAVPTSSAPPSQCPLLGSLGAWQQLTCDLRGALLSLKQPFARPCSASSSFLARLVRSPT